MNDKRCPRDTITVTFKSQLTIWMWRHWILFWLESAEVERNCNNTEYSCWTCPLIFSLADKALMTLTFQHSWVRTLLGHFLRCAAHILSSRLASFTFLLIATCLASLYGAVRTGWHKGFHCTSQRVSCLSVSQGSTGIEKLEIINISASPKLHWSQKFVCNNL